MNPKIAILAPEHFCSWIQELISYYHLDFENQCALSFYTYSSISELPALYEQVYNEYDGFCLSGNSAKKVVFEFSDYKDKPVHTMTAYSSEYYKEFFHLVNRNRQIDLSRVLIDTYLWLGKGVPANVNEYISEDRRLKNVQAKLIQDSTASQILNTEETILKNAISMYKQDKLDWVVCRFSSVYPKLQKAGIPCSFIYPSSDTIVDTITLLLNDIKLRKMTEELPAAIYITSPTFQKDNILGINENSINLQKCILDFDQKQMAGFMVKQAVNGYEIYTTRKIIRKITDQFQQCQLQNYILSTLGIDVQIGYGIGQSLSTASQNSMKALTLAQKSGNSYIILEDGSTIGPLNTHGTLNISGSVSEHIIEAARITNLSISTIQRILSALSILGTNEITTQDLASTLHVTVANANRFLNALYKNGFAEITLMKKSYSKGRPSRVYKILLKE